MLRTRALMLVHWAHAKALLIPDNTPNVTAQDSSRSTFPKAHPSFLAVPSYSTFSKLCLACTCAHVHACVCSDLRRARSPIINTTPPLSRSHRSYVTAPKFAARGTRIWMITCSMLLDKLNWWLRFLTCRGTLRQSHMCTHTPSHTHSLSHSHTCTNIAPKPYPGTVFICASAPSRLLSRPLSLTHWGACRPALSQYIPLYSLSPSLSLSFHPPLSHSPPPLSLPFPPL